MKKIEDSNNGIFLSNQKGEILIRGTKEDLKELVEYINRIIKSEDNNNHIHLDELTIINNNSEIKNLIIEKKDEK